MKRAPARRAGIAAGAIAAAVLGLLGWVTHGHLRSSRREPAAAAGTASAADPTEAALRQAVLRQPGNAAAHAALGRYLLSAARPVSALWELQAARALSSRDASLRTGVAQALAAAGQRSQAITELRALLGTQPDDRPARAQAAALLLETGQPTAAAALLGGPSRGDDPATALLRGRIDFALGRMPEAAAALHRYAGLAPPDSARFQPLGRLLLATGQPEAARRALMQDQRAAFHTTDLHYLLGLSFLRAQPRPDLGKAAAAFAVALHFDPQNARAREALGEALEQQGAVQQAAAQYGAAIQLDPELPEAHERLAHLLRQTEPVQALQQRGIAATLEDQLPEAERAFGAMPKAAPTDLDAIQSFILTCVAMKRIGQSRPAVAALQRLPFDPGTAERVADLYQITGTRAPVRPLAEQWRQREPHAAGPLRLLGRLAIDDLRVSEGIRWLEQAAAIEPQDAPTAAAVGLAWGRIPSKPHLEKAREWLQRAAALAPSDARNHAYLGEVDRQLGQLDAARDELPPRPRSEPGASRGV